MHTKKSGRYDEISNATHPGHLPKEGRRARGKIEIVAAAVDDPNPSLKGKRQRVAVNRLTDVLEREYSYGRISTAAYGAGRAYQAVAEAARPHGARCSVLEPSTGAGDRELAVATRIDNVAVFVAWNAVVRRTIGAWSALVLDGLLLEGMSTQEVARAGGDSSRAGRSKVIEDFRCSLEVLALEWERRGLPRRR